MHIANWPNWALPDLRQGLGCGSIHAGSQQPQLISEEKWGREGVHWWVYHRVTSGRLAGAGAVLLEIHRDTTWNVAVSHHTLLEMTLWACWLPGPSLVPERAVWQKNKRDRGTGNRKLLGAGNSVSTAGELSGKAGLGLGQDTGIDNQPLIKWMDNIGHLSCILLILLWWISCNE